MKTILLCGGRGTRIRDMGQDVPKPMVPLGGRPILWHIMKHYAFWGHKDFVICLGYKGEVIKDFFLKYEIHTNDFTVTLGKVSTVDLHVAQNPVDWRVTLADTGLESLTGTRIKRVQRYLKGEDHFMMTYGDGVSDINLERLLAFHKSHGKIMTVSGVRPPGRFGEVLADAQGRVTEFNEKPQSSEGRISGGYFVCRQELFDYLDPDANQMLELEPMKALVREDQMRLYPHDGFWQPMDTPRDYQYLSDLCEKGRAPWMVWP